MVQIWHNNRCRKSRETLALLEGKNDEINIIEYLKETPTKSEIKDVLKKLEKSPQDIIRKGEKDFKENFKGKDLSEDEWIKAMLKYPKLIERPIVIKDDKAVIGRPPENIEELY